MSDGIGLVAMPHPEGLAELAAEIILLRAENEKLKNTLFALNHAAHSEEYPTSYFRVCGMREILETGIAAIQESGE